MATNRSSTTSLTRSRSTYVPNAGSATGRPTVSGTATSSSAKRTNRPVAKSSFIGDASLSSVASFQPAPSNGTVCSTSNVTLFVTNLRLLNLDDRNKGYPENMPPNSITAASLTTKDQKRRIQTVEYALYHLLALLDPEDTRARLSPLFPPTDAASSLALRAALVRSLEATKRSGILGRDITVRRTMLDECRGERLEEVLQALSSAALKRQVAVGREQRNLEKLNSKPQRLERGYDLTHYTYAAVAETLALEDRGYSNERTQLIVLVLAHRVVLAKLLRGKMEARVQYGDFAGLLRVEEAGMRRRREELKMAEEKFHADGEHVPKDLRTETWRVMRNNWSGDERWLDALVRGDGNIKGEQTGNELLSTPFDRVWRRVRSGRLAELATEVGDGQAGLLQQLTGRVRTQHERLQIWQEFRTRIFGDAARRGSCGPPTIKATEVQPQRRQKGIDLGFGAHESLRLGFGGAIPREMSRLGSVGGELTKEYQNLVHGLQTDLLGLSSGCSPAFMRLMKHRKPVSSESLDSYPSVNKAEHEIVTKFTEDVHDIPTQLKRSAIVTKSRPTSLVIPPPSRLRESPELPLEPSPQRTRPSWLCASASPISPPSRGSWSSIKGSDITALPSLSHPTDCLSTPSKMDRHELDQAVSPTQQLADHILASMNAASPSPLKQQLHALPLTERTRITMTRRTSCAVSPSKYSRKSQKIPFSSGHFVAEQNGQEDDGYFDPLTLHRTNSQHRQERPSEPEETGDDITARTRRSMVGFEAAKQKAQLDRRRSQRKATLTSKRGRTGSQIQALGAVEEEAGERSMTVMLAEELMNGPTGEGVDMEAVFLSRPKVKTSPLGSPLREGFQDWKDGDVEAGEV